MKIALTIDRFEENKAVLKTVDNQTIVWPKEKLPKDIKEGTALTIIISNNSELAEEKKKSAKDILNEILDVNN
ncbi:MAG: DUF3006 domain-containing protein [Patescibacteria group bacterium]